MHGSGRSLDEAFEIEAACQDVVMASGDARGGPRAIADADYHVAALRSAGASSAKRNPG